MKLAKQLASINFLREAIGTRMKLDLSGLLHEGTGGAAATAALKAAAVKGEGGGSGAEAEGKAAAAEATRLAMGDGEAFSFLCDAKVVPYRVVL